MEAVLTTGASSGIGFDAARLLAQKGYRSFGTVRREEDAARLREAGIEPILMDVTDSGSISRAAGDVQIVLAGTPLRALVNNAGVPAAGPIELTNLDEARGVFEVNFFGALAVTQAFLPLLRASRGRVINMSSVSGRFALPFVGIYAASKYALEAASDALRRELLAAGVEVVLIEPGSIQTPIWKHVASIDMNLFRDTEYERIMPAVQRSAVRGGREGLPVERVSRAVYRAVAEQHPPARIPVVASRLRWGLQRLLPVRLWDRLIGRMLIRAESGATVDSPLR
jgi:NAD(P)-dependent dehydrogenase (short-subunit alcohol dehydrogenase family)